MMRFLGSESTGGVDQHGLAGGGHCTFIGVVQRLEVRVGGLLGERMPIRMQQRCQPLVLALDVVGGAVAVEVQHREEGVSVVPIRLRRLRRGEQRLLLLWRQLRQLRIVHSKERIATARVWARLPSAMSSSAEPAPELLSPPSKPAPPASGEVPLGAAPALPSTAPESAPLPLDEDLVEQGRKWNEERIERRLRGEYERAGRALSELVRTPVAVLAHTDRCTRTSRRRCA